MMDGWLLGSKRRLWSRFFYSAFNVESQKKKFIGTVEQFFNLEFLLPNFEFFKYANDSLYIIILYS